MIDPDGRTVGATFLRNNLDKRSIGIDLKRPEGPRAVPALAPHFDVVAENFKAGTMARLGLGYEDVAAVHPQHHLPVGLGLREHRSTTPYDGWPAYAPIVEAMSGIYEYKRPGDQPPITAPVGALGDIATAIFGVIGVLAALRHRDRTGEGQYVDVAMFDADGRDDRPRHQLLVDGHAPEGGRGPLLIMDGFRATDGCVRHAGRPRAPVRAARRS